MDRAGLPKIITQSPHYYVPVEEARKALLNALPSDIFPRLKAQHPALIEVWEAEEGLQVHLVNYARHPQPVQVAFQAPVRARVVSPDGAEAVGGETYEGSSIEIPLYIYKILLVDKL
jgi:hypothetical protein